MARKRSYTLLQIRIKNLRHEEPKHEWDVRVDRGTPLGNPFYMYTEWERVRVCNDYHNWLLNRIKEKNQVVLDELQRLRELALFFQELNLFCWCTPKKCHVESIHDALLYRNDFNIFLIFINRL